MDRRMIILNPLQAGISISNNMLSRGILLKSLSVNEMILTIVRSDNKSDEELDKVIREFKVIYTVLAAYSGIVIPEKVRYKIVTPEERWEEEKKILDEIPPWFPKIW